MQKKLLENKKKTLPKITIHTEKRGAAVHSNHFLGFIIKAYMNKMKLEVDWLLSIAAPHSVGTHFSKSPSTVYFI